MADIFLDVSERFYSIQGESTRAGLPCLFLRLAGCNLRCIYCDSSYTWEEPGEKTALHDLIAWIDSYPRIMVELTGGEPLLQDNIYPLMDELLDKGRTVLVETNGSILIDQIPFEAVVILDIKCPDSGWSSSMNWNNIEQLSLRADRGCNDEVKFVISSEQDYNWAKHLVEKYKLDRIATVLFSTNEHTFHPRELAELILQHSLPVRLQLQLHRILWPTQDRGV